MKQPIKTYNLKMLTAKDSQLFNDFKKLTTYKGYSTREALFKLISGYVSANKIKAKLATETEVLTAAKEKGLSTTKAILIKHRVKGNLDGLWYSDSDDRIVYELTPVLAFLKKRSGRGSGGWLNRSDDGNAKDVGKRAAGVHPKGPKNPASHKQHNAGARKPARTRPDVQE